MEEHYSNKVRAFRWFFYTALPSIFTYMLACIYDLILGFTIIQSLEKHFLEFILMVFAIAISIFGSAMNIERKITPLMKEIYVGLSVLCCFICLVFYGFLYYSNNQSNEVISINEFESANIDIDEENIIESESLITNDLESENVNTEHKTINVITVIHIIFIIIALGIICLGILFEINADKIGNKKVTKNHENL
ncbi:MAG: hypothetical protein HDR04_15395 [Lachnospiraceae bacterium]|nr:hypothetical protein [Lachnospiraceae bacterium]